MGARWATPASSTPTYKAMKMYRNYDGNKSTFGDTSVAAAAPNPDNVAAFAAQRSADGALTVMVISKYLSATTASDDQPRQRDAPRDRASLAAHLGQRHHASRRSRLSGNSIVVTLPPQSVTLFVVPPSGTAPAPPRAPTNVRIIREQ